MLSRTRLLCIGYFYRQLALWLWGVFLFTWFGFSFVHGSSLWPFFGGWLLIKLISYAGIWYLVRLVQQPTFTFYFNLGFTEVSLFAWTYALDLLLFLLAVVLISSF